MSVELVRKVAQIVRNLRCRVVAIPTYIPVASLRELAELEREVEESLRGCVEIVDKVGNCYTVRRGRSVRELCIDFEYGYDYLREIYVIVRVVIEIS